MAQTAFAHRDSLPGVSPIVVVLARNRGPSHRCCGELDLFLVRPSCIDRSRWKSNQDKRRDIPIKRPATQLLSAAPGYGDLWVTNAGGAGRCNACRLDARENSIAA